MELPRAQKVDHSRHHSGCGRLKKDSLLSGEWHCKWLVTKHGNQRVGQARSTERLCCKGKLNRQWAAVLKSNCA